MTCSFFQAMPVTWNQKKWSVCTDSHLTEAMCNQLSVLKNNYDTAV